jgi:hypothetical protein
MVEGPYRKPGERAAVPANERRWFTKTGDVEKGPFDEKVLIRSVRNGLLNPKTLVRPEDVPEWQPLSTIERLAKQTAPALVRHSDPQSADAGEPRGSFGAGLAAGLFGGVIGLALVSLIAKGTDTKRGARLGFLVQVGIGILLRLIALTSR